MLVHHTAAETYTYEFRTRDSLRFPRDQAAFVRTSSDSSWTVLMVHLAVSITKCISWKNKIMGCSYFISRHTELWQSFSTAWIWRHLKNFSSKNFKSESIYIYAIIFNKVYRFEKYYKAQFELRVGKRF